MDKAVVNTPSSPPPSTVTGHLDQIIENCAHGWVFDSIAPDRRLEVEILCDGKVVAIGTANIFREDLAAAGVGDGKHHFRLPISYELFDGEVHELTARTRDGAVDLIGNAQLSSGPANFDFDLMPRAQGLWDMRRLLARHPAAAHASLLHAFENASLLQEIGQRTNARAVYEQLISVLGNHALSHCKIAETYLLDGHYPRAESSYHNAIAADPQFYWAHLGLGNAFRLMAQPLQAEAAYRNALALQPSCPRAKARLLIVCDEVMLIQTRTFIEEGKIEHAIALLRDVIIRQPDHGIALAQLTKLLPRAFPHPGLDITLPGLAQLQTFQTAQRLLGLVVAEAESRMERLSK